MNNEPKPHHDAAPACPGQASETREAAQRGGAQVQPNNPLHGMTLEAILNALVDHYGWDGLGERIPVRCFNIDPSIPSSLRFLRKTPWARDKVEGLYGYMLREQRRTKAQK